jgi:hypothetical protein
LAAAVPAFHYKPSLRSGLFISIRQPFNSKSFFRNEKKAGVGYRQLQSRADRFFISETLKKVSDVFNVLTP